MSTILSPIVGIIIFHFYLAKVMFFSQWLYSVDDETAFPLQDSQGQCECLHFSSEHVQVETSPHSHTMQLLFELLARLCDNLDSLSWSLFDLWLFSYILLLKNAGSCRMKHTKNVGCNNVRHSAVSWSPFPVLTKDPLNFVLYQPQVSF